MNAQMEAVVQQLVAQRVHQEVSVSPDLFVSHPRELLLLTSLTIPHVLGGLQLLHLELMRVNPSLFIWDNYKDFAMLELQTA